MPAIIGVFLFNFSLKSTKMNILFFDDNSFDNLLPLTFTRPVADLRVGILKIHEKWKYYLPDSQTGFLTRSYLNRKFPGRIEADNILITGAMLPDMDIAEKISVLKKGDCLFHDERLIAARLDENSTHGFVSEGKINGNKSKIKKSPEFIDYPWQIFSLNGEEIKKDFEFITANRKSAPISSTNNLIGDNIFLEEGAKLEYTTINTSSGPVYLGKNAEIMEGSVVRGPLAMADHSVLKMMSKIYGPTTLGPWSKVGGEVNNSVFQGYSNKAHDGFLGNSVIGEWCNLGADTNNSNLKNNYATVRLWNYPSERFINTGLQFCGLIMGDHSKCGINTMFNTGTVVGVNANIFGSGFPRNFIPSFSWGGAHGFTTYSIPKAFEVASLVMQRRNLSFDKTEQSIMEEIFRQTEKYRK